MSLQITGEYRGGEVIHDAVMMEKVCHAIVVDMGSDKVFWEEIRKEKHGE